MEQQLKQLREESKIEGDTNSLGGTVWKLKPKGDPYSDAVRARQKGKTSDRKKLAGKIHGLKMTKDKDELSRKAMQFINDPKVSAIEIAKLQNYLINDSNLSDRDKISLLKAICEVHKTIFPQTQKIEINTFERDLQKFNENYFHMKQLTAVNISESKEDENSVVISDESLDNNLNNKMEAN